MTLVDFAKVRASLADKAIVGFENGLDKASTAKCGLPKVNATKRGPKPSPAQA